MAMMSFRIQKYLDGMNGALLNFLNFFLHFIAFFLLLHVFCEKKQNTRARLFSLARRETTKIGPHDAHRWKRCASEFFLARNHPRVGRVVRTLPVVQRDLRKDAFRVTDSKKGVPKRLKMRSKSSENQTNMSGRGKGKSSKKAVSRSAKAGLQFPVGRIARYVVDID